MNNLRKIWIMVLSFLFGVIFLWNLTLAKSAPNFKDDFATELTSDNGDSLYSPDGVSSKNTLKQNVEKLGENLEKSTENITDLILSCI